MSMSIDFPTPPKALTYSICKFHSSFSQGLPRCDSYYYVDASVNIANQVSTIIKFPIILTFLSHISVKNLLSWVTLESCIGWTFVPPSPRRIVADYGWLFSQAIRIQSYPKKLKWNKRSICKDAGKMTVSSYHSQKYLIPPAMVYRYKSLVRRKMMSWCDIWVPVQCSIIILDRLQKRLRSLGGGWIVFHCTTD